MNGRAREDGRGWYEIWREVKPDKKKGEDFEPYWENTGKPYKHKDPKAMLKWYNKLHTDSAEYEMWGNGIALPPALYCMQGMVDVLNAAAGIQETIPAEPIEENKTPIETKEETMKEETKITAPAPEPEKEPVLEPVRQLKRLAEERKALAKISPDERFENDVRAIEYAVSVLEALAI